MYTLVGHKMLDNSSQCQRYTFAHKIAYVWPTDTVDPSFFKLKDPLFIKINFRKKYWIWNFYEHAYHCESLFSTSTCIDGHYKVRICQNNKLHPQKLGWSHSFLHYISSGLIPESLGQGIKVWFTLCTTCTWCLFTNNN